MHLAQLNVARLLHPIDDPRIADFVGNLDRINAVADRSPGFVWRLQSGSGNATDIASPWGPHVIVNLSVWETPDALERFTWQTVHRAIYRRRAEWFAAMRSNHLAFWWVPEGHRPGVAEAKDRLDHLDAHGDTDEAFGWSHLPSTRLWREQRCA